MTRPIAHETGRTVPVLAFAIFGPAAAWTARLLVAYALVPLACETGTNLWLHAVSAAMLAVSIAVGVVAYFGWRGPSPEDAPDSTQRYRWAMLFGIGMSVIFSLAIVYESAANFVFDPCQRSV